MAEDRSGPAFPSEYIEFQRGAVGNEVDIMGRSSGMTLRDYFAAAALTGIYASRDLQMATLHDIGALHPGDFEGAMAKQSYLQADAMLEARK